MPLHRKSGNELPHSKGTEPPVVLVKRYDWVKWELDRAKRCQRVRQVPRT